MSKKNNYKVYVHINKTNGKRYYGITGQDEVEKRWMNGLGYKYNEHFWNSICKYGWDEFEHIVIAKGLTEKEAKWLEIELIREWDTTNDEYGYNITKGGDDNPMDNEEIRKKVIKLCGKQIYVIELDMTFDSISECARYLGCGKKSISKALKEDNNICKGYHIIYAKDKDNKELIEEVMKHVGKDIKAVYIVELDKEFSSITECAKFLGCDKKQVSKVAKGEQGFKTAKGYHIIYAKDRDKLAS